MKITMASVFVLGCSANPASSPATEPDAPPATPDAAVDTPPAAGVLPTVQLCAIADAKNLASAYTSQTDGSYVAYSCAMPCADVASCTTGMLDQAGNPTTSARGGMQMQLLAFVVDGMAGHLAFTPDGGDIEITHAGSGGTSTFNAFDRVLQAHSTLKTFSLGWMPGTPVIFGSGGGWFTRKDATPASVRQQVARPAAVIQFVHDQFGAGHKLGTVGSSMGTVATLGAHVWYGLEPIIDYQMLIGGPGMWDVNAGCGRVHISQGFCDADVSPCTGNPMSSYGDNDTACGSDATNNCRVPTIMAPLSGGASAYDNCINYVGMTTACAAQATDARDATLDDSSMLDVASWSFHGKVDFVANEGGTQPPDADQGMGEGHMMYIYNALTGAKSWTDNEGHHHGDAWDKDPVLMAAAAMKVIAGMGQ
jgi:hypothetical protein